jgi:ubiquinone/menaquinone biosynthesis C-methylase UbiE
MARLLATLPCGKKVLDVPFGTGRFVNLYLARGAQVFGVDASADMLAIAAQELGDEFEKCTIHLGDAARLPYSDNYFDLVVSFRFLSHVVSYWKAKRILRELGRVSAAELILQFRIRHEYCEPIRDPFPWEPMADRLRLAQITKLLQGFRLKVLEVERLEERSTYYRGVLLCRKCL